MARTDLAFVIGLVVIPLGCGEVGRSAPTSVPIGSPRTKTIAVEREDLDVARRRLLAALDAGDLSTAASELGAPMWTTATAKPFASIVRAYDIPGPTRHSKLLANVVPLRVGAIPSPAARNTKEARLVAARVTSPSLSEQAWANDGQLFAEHPGAQPEPPTWLPSRLGDKPIRRLRASDGRWLALWGDRYLAILGGRATVLLDFAAWAETAPSERVSVDWADVSGDVVYVKARRPMGGGFITAIAVPSGKPLWRSDDGAFTEAFVVANTTIVAWKYGARPGGGELVTIRRDTGATEARRTTPEVESGDCHLTAAGGVVHCFASSELMGGTGLKHGESLEIQEPAPAPAPPPPEPSDETIPIAKQAPLLGTDARAVAWELLDHGDPRAAILALRAHLGDRPTDIAALALDEIARTALDAARDDAAKAILARHPPVTAGATASGNAPVRHSSRGKLVVVSQKSITPQQMPSEFPPITDDERLIPAYVPEKLGLRGRNQEASSIVNPNERVEIYWGYGSPSLSVWFRGGKVHSVMEHPNEVRASNASGDVLLTVAGHGRFFLEAHDSKTGALYYRSKEELHDQYIVVEDGYVVASAVGPTADIVLLAADTGKVVSRVHLPAPQDPFLVFRKGASIMAVNMRTSVTLAIE